MQPKNTGNKPRACAFCLSFHSNTENCVCLERRLSCLQMHLALPSCLKSSRSWHINHCRMPRRVRKQRRWPCHRRCWTSSSDTALSALPPEPGLQGRFSLAHGNKNIHSATGIQGDRLYQDDSLSICISSENCLQQSLKSQEERNSSVEGCWLFMVMQPTPVFLPGESPGQRSLAGYSPWGRKESDTTERVHFHFHFQTMKRGFPGGASGKESACQCKRHKRCGFNPWVRKIPWRKKWQPTPVFLPGESHGQRSLAGYSPQCCRVRHDWGYLEQHKESKTQDKRWAVPSNFLICLVHFESNS